MAVLTTTVDPRAPGYLEGRSVMTERLGEFAEALRQAHSGDGERHVTRHHARGKLLARERVELLVDRDAPLLELSPTAGWGTGYPVGAGVVTAIGIVEGTACVVVANEPTVRGGAVNRYTVKKIRRAAEIARQNRLPLVSLVESAGPDLSSDADSLFSGDGSPWHDLTRLSAAGVATVAVVFGAATAGYALVPGLSDYTIFIRERARVVLAPGRGDVDADGPGDDDPVHDGLVDFVAEDERDALRIARAVMAQLPGGPPRRPAPCPAPTPWPASAPRPASAPWPHPVPESPRYDPAELIAVTPADPWTPAEPVEILARVLDGSRFEEFKPGYGPALRAGWGAVHGYPVAVLADGAAGYGREPGGAAEVGKAVQFVQLADASGRPLLFLRGARDPRGPVVPGGATGADRQDAAVRLASTLANVVANSRVPHLTVDLGPVPEMGGTPRFHFRWPSGRTGSGPRSTEPTATERIERESAALFRSGRVDDDGVIDPRDTRTVLGFCLALVTPVATAAVPTGPAPAGPAHGVFRI